MNGALVFAAVALAMVSAVSAHRITGCEFVFQRNATGGIYKIDIGRQTTGIKFNDDGSWETLSLNAPELKKIVGTKVQVWGGSSQLSTDGDLELEHTRTVQLKDDSTGVFGTGWVAHFLAHSPEYVYAIFMENKVAFVLDNDCKLKTAEISELDHDVFATVHEIQAGTVEYVLANRNIVEQN